MRCLILGFSRLERSIHGVLVLLARDPGACPCMQAHLSPSVCFASGPRFDAAGKPRRLESESMRKSNVSSCRHRLRGEIKDGEKTVKACRAFPVRQFLLSCRGPSRRVAAESSCAVEGSSCSSAHCSLGTTQIKHASRKPTACKALRCAVGMDNWATERGPAVPDRLQACRCRAPCRTTPPRH